MGFVLTISACMTTVGGSFRDTYEFEKVSLSPVDILHGIALDGNSAKGLEGSVLAAVNLYANFVEVLHVVDVRGIFADDEADGILLHVYALDNFAGGVVEGFLKINEHIIEGAMGKHNGKGEEADMGEKKNL